MMFKVICILLLSVTLVIAGCGRKFPHDFIFGVATSGYQIEGAWNLDGKGENIWDRFTRRVPSPIANNDNADVAADSYHKYEEDIALIAGLGVKYYRFSISWSRVLPTGYADQINEKGLEYYKNLTQAIKRHNLIPVATLYHWDLPQRLYDDGIHWTNVSLVKHFVDYARIVIRHLPEVELWNTINEPKQVCHYGYGWGALAPGVYSDGKLEYQCVYVVLKAHAAVYHMYKQEFSNYTAKVSLVPDCQFAEPLTNSTSDAEAADRKEQFDCGIYLHPLYIGGWPPVVESRIAKRSSAAGLSQSRLPAFTQEEIDYIKGTNDILTFNHYVTSLISDVPEGPDNVTSYDNDVRVKWVFSPSEEVGSNGYTITPWGLRKMLNWLQDQYNPSSILITEIGISENGTTLNDQIRINFYTGMYCNVLDALYIDNVNITGIIAWSIIDNFEWLGGYKDRFGVYYVDFKDPNRPRKPKSSVEFYKKLTKTRKLDCPKKYRYQH